MKFTKTLSIAFTLTIVLPVVAIFNKRPFNRYLDDTKFNFCRYVALSKIDTKATMKANLMFTCFKMLQGKKDKHKLHQQCIENKLNQIKETLLIEAPEMAPLTSSPKETSILRLTAIEKFRRFDEAFLEMYKDIAEIDELHKLKARLAYYQPQPMSHDLQVMNELRVMKQTMNQKFI